MRRDLLAGPGRAPPRSGGPRVSVPGPFDLVGDPGRPRRGTSPAARTARLRLRAVRAGWTRRPQRPDGQAEADAADRRLRWPRRGSAARCASSPIAIAAAGAPLPAGSRRGSGRACPRWPPAIHRWTDTGRPPRSPVPVRRRATAAAPPGPSRCPDTRRAARRGTGRARRRHLGMVPGHDGGPAQLVAEVHRLQVAACARRTAAPGAAAPAGPAGGRARPAPASACTRGVERALDRGVQPGGEPPICSWCRAGVRPARPRGRAPPRSRWPRSAGRRASPGCRAGARPRPRAASRPPR